MTNGAGQIRTLIRDLMEVPIEEALRQIFSLFFVIYKENATVLIEFGKTVPELKEFTENIKLDIYTHSTNIAFLEQHQDEITATDLPAALHKVVEATTHEIERYLSEDRTPSDISGDEEAKIVERLTRMALDMLVKQSAWHQP